MCWLSVLELSACISLTDVDDYMLVLEADRLTSKHLEPETQGLPLLPVPGLTRARAMAIDKDNNQAIVVQYRRPYVKKVNLATREVTSFFNENSTREYEVQHLPTQPARVHVSNTLHPVSSFPCLAIECYIQSEWLVKWSVSRSREIVC